MNNKHDRSKRSSDTRDTKVRSDTFFVETGFTDDPRDLLDLSWKNVGSLTGKAKMSFLDLLNTLREEMGDKVRLNMSFNHLGNLSVDQLRLLGDCLKLLNIRALNIAGNKFSLPQFVAGFASLPPSLEFLTLDMGNITPESDLQSLIRLLPESLKKLEFQGVFSDHLTQLMIDDFNHHARAEVELLINGTPTSHAKSKHSI